VEQLAVSRVLAGRYRLDQPLGGGGMGSVWDGWDLRLGRPVARLVHPNVVAVFDVGDERGRPFIVMERLSGKTLRDELAAGPLVPGAVRRLGVDVASAVQAAHSAGVVHRDIKPANILLGEDGSWKVADFGIARAIDTLGPDMTTPGLLIGTPAYVAPELVAGERPTTAVDIYAVGAVMYEALAGRKPYDAETPVAVLSQIAAGPPPPLPAGLRGADPDLALIVDRAMAREPGRRFATAGDLREALARVPADLTIAVEGPAGVGDTQVMTPAWPPASVGVARRWSWRPIAAVAAAIAVVALGWSLASSQQDSGAHPARGSAPTSVVPPSTTTPTTATTIAPAPPAPPPARHHHGHGGADG
jgi:serine/threonine protein kinase